MVPPAPGRFSTISGCPLANCAKPFDRLRDSVSPAPPAPTGTKSRTGRSGHCAAGWAKAGTAANAASARVANAVAWRRARLAKCMTIPPVTKASSLINSLELDVRGLHNLRPLFELGLQKGLGLCGRHRHRFRAELLPRRPHVGSGNQRPHLGVEQVDDRLGR